MSLLDHADLAARFRAAQAVYAASGDSGDDRRTYYAERDAIFAEAERRSHGPGHDCKSCRIIDWLVTLGICERARLDDGSWGVRRIVDDATAATLTEAALATGNRPTWSAP